MATPIGHITIAHGSAVAVSATGSRPLKVGDPVFQDDEISTGDQSALEIRFTDDTIMAQGENAQLVLDEYVFDPSTGQGALNFDMIQGTFRSVTGTIVDNNPDGFELETPLATIGIRGTTTAHTIPPSWATDQTENHVVLVYDGKPVLVIPQGDGTARLIDTSGRKVEVSDIGISDVKVMTVAEYIYFEQYSSEQLGEDTPTWDSPQDVIGDDPTTDRPVSNNQENQDADTNLADLDNDGDVDEDDAEIAEGQGDDTGESQELEGNGLDNLLTDAQLILEDGTTLDVSTTNNASQSLNTIYGATTTTSGDNTLITVTSTTSTTTTGTTTQTVSMSPGTTTLTASQVSSGFVAQAPTGTGTFTISVSSNTPPPSGTSVTADFSSFNSNQVVNFDASAITSSSAGYFSVTGGSAGDTISGTNHNTDGDTIKGGEGNDTLKGYIGNDTIYGGNGNDTIYGNQSGGGSGSGSDNDIIYGDAGQDTMYGNEGNDTFVYRGTSDVASGETIDGGTGTDTIRVDSDTDFTDLDLTYDVQNVERFEITAGVTASFEASDISDLTNFQIFGATGTPATTETLSFQLSSGTSQSFGTLVEIVSNWGSEDIFQGLGSTGNETFNGSDNSEIFYGYAGNDTFTANMGTDKLYGGEGDDSFAFGSGYTDADTVDGGNGTDTMSFKSDGTTTYELTNVTKIETLTLGNAATKLSLSGTMSPATSSFTVNASALTSTSSLILDASSFQDALSLTAGQGSDTITGSSQNDTFTFTSGKLTASDTVNGGAGNDTLIVSGTATKLTGVSNVETITINDVYDGNINLAMADNQNADSASVTVDATALNHVEGSGTFTFNASTEAGASFTVKGGIRADSLTTGGGNDTLTGGQGNDTLTGGSGSDIFRYEATNEGGDTITDFVSGTDKVVFGNSFNNSFSFRSGGYEGTYSIGQEDFGAWFVYDTMTGRLWYDADGGGQGAETLIATLTGTPDLQSADITVETGGL